MGRKNKPQAHVTTRQDLERRIDEAKHDEAKRKAPGQRSVRYVYHVHGHAKLHGVHAGAHEGPVVPFEVVLRRPFAIDSDEVMEGVRHEVRGHVVESLDREGSPYVVGDIMIRGVSRLHRILVEADDPQGPAVRIMS